MKKKVIITPVKSRKEVLDSFREKGASIDFLNRLDKAISDILEECNINNENKIKRTNT